MATNLTSKQIQTWQKNINTIIKEKLIISLKKSNEYASSLKKITASSKTYENDLSYRFNDLTKLTLQAAKQLSTFMNAFDSSLSKYVKDTQAAEEVAAEKIRKSIDQFAEAASKISKLKM